MSDLFTRVPDGDWRAIESAPTTGPVYWCYVWNGRKVVRAHFALDQSGDEQPPFGPAWFYSVRGTTEPDRVLFFRQVVPAPTHWLVGSESQDEQFITLDEVCEHCGGDRAKLFVDRDSAPDYRIYAQCLGCRRVIRKIVAGTSASEGTPDAPSDHAGVAASQSQREPNRPDNG